MALKGPTAMGMVQFMDQADTGALTDNHYHFTITAVTDEASAALGNGSTDIAAIPAKPGLGPLQQHRRGHPGPGHQHPGGGCISWSGGDSVQSVEDLRGRTIYASGKGTTPEYALNYVLSQNGIDPATDVTMEWKSEQAECLSALMADENAIAMLAPALCHHRPRPRAPTSGWPWT